MQIVCHDNRSIEHSEMKLFVFHLIDVVQRYDTVIPGSADRITWQDVYLANIIVARTAKQHWTDLIGRSIRDISTSWDLIGMDDNEWIYCRAIMTRVLQPFLANRGIGCSVVTKALHRKRPHFLPICDDVVVRALEVKQDRKSAETIARCMDEFREVGRKNLRPLEAIDAFLKSSRLPELSYLRMIEALYWMEGTTRYQRLWKVLEAEGWFLQPETAGSSGRTGTLRDTSMPRPKAPRIPFCDAAVSST